MFLESLNQERIYMSEDEQFLKELLIIGELAPSIAEYMVLKNIHVTQLLLVPELKGLCTPQFRSEIISAVREIMFPNRGGTVINHYTYNFYGSMPKENKAEVVDVKENGKKAIEVEKPKVVSIPLNSTKTTKTFSPIPFNLEEDEE